MQNRMQCASDSMKSPQRPVLPLCEKTKAELICEIFSACKIVFFYRNLWPQMGLCLATEAESLSLPPGRTLKQGWLALRCRKQMKHYFMKLICANPEMKGDCDKTFFLVSESFCTEECKYIIYLWYHNHTDRRSRLVESHIILESLISF